MAGVEAVWQTASRGGGSWTNNTFLLIKTNAAGEVEWRKNYTRGNAYSVSLTNDGGYLLAGRGQSNLVKVDSEGNMQWNKTFTAFDNSGMVYSAIQTKDGGYAIVGTDESKEGPEGALVKTDSEGSIQWTKTYGEPNKLYDAYSVVETNDCGYAIAGKVAPGAGYGDMWLLKTDVSGEVQWEKTYGGQEPETANSIVKTGDGGYLLVGSTDSVGAGNSDGWAVKVDSQGNKQWSKTFGEEGEDFFKDAVQASDGGYVITGITNSIKNPVVVVVKLSAFGELDWEKSYEGDHSAESIIATSDGGYAFAGYKNRDVSRNITVWLVKIATDVSAQQTQLFDTILIVVALVIVAGLGLGLLVYLIRKK